MDEQKGEEDPFTTLERTNWQLGFEAYDKGFGPLTRKVIPTLLQQAGFPPASDAQQERQHQELHLSSSHEPTSEDSNNINEFHFLDVATGPGYVLLEAWNMEQSSNQKENRSKSQLSQQYPSSSLSSSNIRYTYTAMDISTNFLNMAQANLKSQCLSQEELQPKFSFVSGDASQTFPFETESFDCICCNFGILHLSNPESFLSECARTLKANCKLSFSVWDAPPATEGFDLILCAIQEGVGNLEELSMSLPQGPPFFRFAQEEEIVNSMTAAGFDDISIHRLECLEWDTIQSSEQLYDIFLEGTARTRELLLRQKATDTLAIQNELERLWNQTTKNGTRRLNMPVVVVSGRKR